MPAREFEVQGAHDFEGALVCWWKDGDSIPVIVRIPARTFEAIFKRPRLTRRQCSLLAEGNLEQVARIAAKEHAAAAEAGEEPLTLALDAAAIERGGAKLSDSVLEIDAGSGWLDPVGGGVTRADPT
jgi:hypothetical protein